MIHSIAWLFGLDINMFKKSITEEVPETKPAVAPPLRYLMAKGVSRVYTPSGATFFDFTPLSPGTRGKITITSVYLVRLDGVQAFRGRVAGFYRKHHGVVEKSGIPVLWARRALYDAQTESTTRVSKIVCGISKNLRTATMVRISFDDDEGNECSIDFHLVDFNQCE
jgi:hypothetical protein